MSTKWNFVQETLPTSTWSRVWRTENFTEYGTDYSLRFHYEDIKCDSNKTKLASIDRGIVERFMSKVSADPDVILLRDVLTRLSQKWYLEDHPAVEEVVPEAAVAADESKKNTPS